MKHIELVRTRLAQGMDRSIRQFLGWLSCTEGNLKEVDSLRIALERSDLKPEPELIAKLTETVLESLGHTTQIRGKPEDGYSLISKAQRSARKL